MYSIGKFSKLTGVSTKTLIWYDKVGLLKPEKVDSENGYRYYGDESFKKLADIHFWQSMEFSVKEIVNLSSEVIKSKIKELKNKIDIIQSNIYLLQKFQEENMDKKEISIFDAQDRLLLGKWRYEKSSTNFRDTIEYNGEGKREEYMPRYLFFGEGNIGTDTKGIFDYSFSSLSLKDKKGREREFWCFVLNHANTLVLYEKPDEDKPNKKVKFHIYDKSFSHESYSSEEIKQILEKSKPVSQSYSEDIDLNSIYLGKWKMYDEIKESQVESYNGEIIEKFAGFPLSPMFDILDISEDKLVVTMENGEDNEVIVKSSSGERRFTQDNTIMSIHMHKTEPEKFAIYNPLLKILHVGKYRKIGDEEYLFVKLDDIPDIDETVYVYKKC